ncbi:hypothetical protein CEN47_17370 [Fischerella thermalis CCMEE 5319]|jgi:hypothetical protein|nr:hypothetical protein CEN47_17370 [Fischerella thermalis CCMEE 5319]
MNKRVYIFLSFFSSLFFTSCKAQSDLYRELVIVDCQTEEMIPSANIVFSSKDTTFNINTEAIPDTLTKKIVNAEYRIEVMAAGYKKVDENYILSESDKILKICLIPLELDSINVNWDGAIISIKDSSGRIKSIRHKQ